MSYSGGSTPNPSLDVTLDVRGGQVDRAAVEGDSGSDCATAFCCHGGVIAGSEAGLTGYTRKLLLVRLRAAAMMLSGAFLVFLLFSLMSSDDYAVIHNSWPLQLGAVAVLLTVLGGLFKYPRMANSVLRSAEFVIFATPVAFFLIMDAWGVSSFVEKYAAPMSVSTKWLLLMMIYALMIPNSWKRAAVVNAVMALTPIIELLVLRAVSPQVASVLTPGFLAVDFLALITSAVAATYGVSLINSLRERVFEANQVGVYQLKRLLGRGGMGEVFLAEHQLLKRPAAIKLIRQESAGDPRALLRFEREVRAAATLSHPNTIEIYDYGRTEDGTFYYVMEYLRGLTLADLVARFGPVHEQRAVHLLLQAAGALAEAHRAGLTHRDLKPANIFAAERGGIHDFIKLLDFGLVKTSSKSQDSDLTTEGSITGSPYYMSPEQAVGSTADARSDLYSLGAVAYFLLTGHPPFDGESPMAVLIAHARDAVRPISEFRSDVSPRLEAAIARCLEKQPQNRYQSAAELAVALRDCVVPGEWDAQTAADWWQSQAPRELAEVG